MKKYDKKRTKRHDKNFYNTRLAYFEIFDKYCECVRTGKTPQIRLTKAMIYGLIFFKKGDFLPNYNYQSNFNENLYYCSDRMNGGRARSLLVLFNKEYGSYKTLIKK